MGKRRNILATEVTKALPRPNITEGRMSATAGKASRTTVSPSPRLRMYGDEDPASEPMPETWIKCLTPASRARRRDPSGGGSDARSPHERLTAFTTPSTACYGSDNGAIIVDVGMARTRCRAELRGKALQCVLDAAMRPERKNRAQADAGRRGGREKPVPPNTVIFPCAIVQFPRRCLCAIPSQDPSAWAATFGGRLATRSAKRQVRLIVTRRVLRQTSLEQT